MFIQARTPYREATTGKLVRDGKSIALHYLKSWFIIDLLSVVPFELTAIGQGPDNPNVPISKQKGNLTQLRLLRFLRLMRLLKLLRVLRASRKLKQWRVYIDIRYTALQLVKVSQIHGYWILRPVDRPSTTHFAAFHDHHLHHPLDSLWLSPRK